MSDKFFILFQYLVPQHLLSRLVGALARCRAEAVKNTFILWFIARYRVNMEEALQPDPTAYACFNDFFTRALKEGVRPLAAEPDKGKSLAVCPADGAISQLGAIKDGLLYQAKGHNFSLVDLLGGSEERAAAFQDGSFATVYLSPRDYHRVHMPLSGTLKEMIYVPGRLFSVNRLTAENVPGLFARNERVVCLFDTGNGPMALVLVGAMIVAGAETVWAGEVCPGNRRAFSEDYSQQSPPLHIGRGEEMGRFKLGSTVVAVFGPNAVKLNTDLMAGNTVRLGQALGQP